MDDKEKYLKNLKKELDKYTKQLSNIQKEFKGNTAGSVEKINQSLQEILREAIIAYGKLESASAAEWDPVKKITNQAFNNLRDTFQEKINSSTQYIQDCAEQVGDTYHEQIECVEKYVRKHPIKSLLIAVGTGFIIGKILK